MPRFFNTAGPCLAGKHYMLPARQRLPGVERLIEQELYFVLHAPRQSGKTTSVQDLARSLTAAGRYAALYASCETGQTAGDDIERAVRSVLYGIGSSAEWNLPAELRPPPEDPAVAAEVRLRHLLAAWAHACPRPVVLFLDEIDALQNGSLVSVLRQLRDGYTARPAPFPRSVGLVGLRDVRDVRDYKVRVRSDRDTLGTASPFNVKVRSLTLAAFSPEDVAALYRQHTDETGQLFTDEAVDRAWELTRGQPWLVNALAYQITETDIPDRTRAITAAHIEAAKETLILRRDTHLDSLVERLREERVRRVIEPILLGELTVGDRILDDIAYAEDLGLVTRADGHLRIANPIYHEVVPRALAGFTQATVYHETAWYVAADGRLDLPGLLRGFVAFWTEHAEVLLGAQPYPEAAPHLVLMAFLQRIVNSGGSIDREYAVGRGRMDLCLRWPHPGGLQREALELKVWRDGRPDPLTAGLDQLAAYLDRLGLDHGVLVLFDRRKDALPLPERVSIGEREHDGRRVTLLRL